MSRTIDSHATYLERVVQLIPAEVVAAHLTIQGLVYNQIRIRDVALEISAGVLFVLLPLYLWRLGVTSKKQIALTMGSFLIWVLAVSLPVHQRSGLDPLWGSIILVLWTTVIPVLVVPGVAGSGSAPNVSTDGEGETGGLD